MNLQVLQGDALETLATLPAGSVHCCITSPPYWGLRDYGTAKWEGGDATCSHKPKIAPRRDRPLGRLRGSTQRDCHCGARRIDSQIGLEQTPEAYVSKLVEVFREVRRVLRDDGTLWLNLGDSYGSAGGNTHAGFNARYHGTQSVEDKQARALDGVTDRTVSTGLPAKNLIGIPWRVAFALQADGWWLRQDIIWHKPNPMPESVTDRCTKAHEYVFLMAKAARYYYDLESIREPMNPNNKGIVRTPTHGDHVMAGGHREQARRVYDQILGANRRSVWSVTTKPYKAAHFATFPPDLVRPMVRAGSPRGGTVLDPFAGSGTTLAVAIEEGRNAVGIELNPDYINLIRERTSSLQVGML